MAVLKGGVKFFSNFQCLCKCKVTGKEYYFAVFVISSHQCDSVKKSGFWVDYFLRYLSLKTALNFTAAILELIWSQNPKVKIAVSQKLF